MEIVKLKNKKFGDKNLYVEVNGFAIKSDQGYLAFSNSKKRNRGIVIPYMPIGGRKTLSAILNESDWLEEMDGLEFIKPLE